MSLILVLDDERSRHDRFTQIFTTVPGAVVRRATSVPEATVLVLAYGRFHLMCLDHDLGQNLDGRDFCNWLCQYPRLAPEKVLIHSRNPVAATEMHQILHSRFRGAMLVVIKPFQPAPTKIFVPPWSQDNADRS